MLGDLGKSLVDRYKNPCKKCIVRATCEPWTTNCDKWEKFIDQRNKAESTGDNIEVWAVIILIILGMLLVAVTFGLGIVKWSEMFF